MASRGCSRSSKDWCDPSQARPAPGSPAPSLELPLGGVQPPGLWSRRLEGQLVWVTVVSGFPASLVALLLGVPRPPPAGPHPRPGFAGTGEGLVFCPRGHPATPWEPKGLWDQQASLPAQWGASGPFPKDHSPPRPGRSQQEPPAVLGWGPPHGHRGCGCPHLSFRFPLSSFPLPTSPLPWGVPSAPLGPTRPRVTPHGAGLASSRPQMPPCGPMPRSRAHGALPPSAGGVGPREAHGAGKRTTFPGWVPPAPPAPRGPAGLQPGALGREPLPGGCSFYQTRGARGC